MISQSMSTRVGGITLTVGGKKIGEMESLSYKPSEEPKPIGRPILEGTLSLEGESFVDRAIMRDLMGVQETFDVVVNTYPLGAPPYKLRSKKKRLRKKWAKKYPVNKTEYKNCTITGVMEHATMD